MTLQKLQGFFEDHVAGLHAKGIAKGDEKIIVGLKPPQDGFSERYLLEGYSGRAFLRMNSNSYLGLSLHPRVIEAEARAAELFGTGPVTSAGLEAGAFVNPIDRDGTPTIQAFCVPIVYIDRGSQDAVKDDYGLSITTVVIKPKSRGEIRLRSADATDPPMVSPNLLSDPQDIARLNLLQSIVAASYNANSALLPIIITEAIKLTLNRGIHPTSSVMFAGFGIILSGVLLDYPLANKAANVAQALLNRFGLQATRWRAATPT